MANQEKKLSESFRSVFWGVKSGLCQSSCPILSHSPHLPYQIRLEIVPFDLQVLK